MKLLNSVGVATATTGTGTITLGSVLGTNFFTFAEAGAVDGDEVYYRIDEGGNVEIGIGTIGGSETTLSRDTVLASRISGSAGTTKLTLGGAAQVRAVTPAEALLGVDAAEESDPADGDLVGILIAASGYVLKKLTWANLKSSLAGSTFLRWDAAQSISAAQQAQARANLSAALKGHIYGLTLSNNGSDANNDIDIAAGEAASTETNPVLMVLSSAITKRLDAAWAVGTNQGGLDTGSKANSTWYYVWLIRRSDTGVVDVLFSTSATSPTMPANYDQKRRLPGAIKTDGSGNIIAFIMSGRRITWKAIPGTAEYSSSSLGTTAATSTPSFVPTAFKVRAFYSVAALRGSSVAVILITDPDTDDVAPGDGAAPLGSVIAPSSFRMTTNGEVITSATGTIRLRANATSNTVVLLVYAWEDYLA